MATKSLRGEARAKKRAMPSVFEPGLGKFKGNLKLHGAFLSVTLLTRVFALPYLEMIHLMLLIIRT